MANQGLPLSSLSDLVNHTLAEFIDKGDFESFYSQGQYNWLEKMFPMNRRKIQGGEAIEWRASRGDNGSFRYIRPFEVTPNNHIDVFTKGRIGWCHAEGKAVWNNIIAKSMTDKYALADYMKGQYEVMMKSVVDGLEASGFNLPENSSDDKTPHGLPYWFPMLGVGVEDPVGGFNGTTAVYGDGSTTTTIGNTDRSTALRAKTWVGTYTGANSAMLDSIRNMQEYTLFKKPQDLEQYAKAIRNNFALFSGTRMRLSYESLVNAGPDDRNGDANPFHGQLTFRGQPWLDVRSLDDVANDPIYHVNFQKFQACVHSAFWAKWDDEIKQDDRHTYSKARDYRFNYLLLNEQQGGGVIHKKRTA